MKSSQFKRKSKAKELEFNQEKPYIKKKRINWGLVIYSVIVLILLFFLGRFIIRNFFYVSAPGQVLYKKFEVQLPAKAQLFKIYKEEGENVSAGDTLFRYAWQDALNPSNNYSSGYARLNRNRLDPEWLQKEILGIQKDIEQLRIENRGYRDLLGHYQRRLKNIKQGIYLDIYTTKELDNLIDKISTLRSKINTNLSEINDLLDYKRSLNSNLASSKERMRRLMDQNLRFNPDTLRKYADYFISPISGNLTNLFKANYEIASESEKIMTIHKDNRLIVRAYFDQEDLKHVDTGMEVSVRFPDGSKHKGEVEQLYFATHVLPAEFQKKDADTDRRIAADIKPLKNSDLSAWRSFYKMRVKITKQILFD